MMIFDEIIDSESMKETMGDFSKRFLIDAEFMKEIMGDL